VFDSTNQETGYNSIYLDTELRLIASFEAAFTFSLTWALANQFKQEALHFYIDFLNSAIEKYCK